MVVSILRGGIGNQLFQYACGRAIANRLGSPLYLDLESMSSYSSRHYALSVYKLKAKTIRSNSLWRRGVRKLGLRTAIDDLSTIKQKKFVYDDVLERIDGPVILDGYWQSPRYFSDIHKQLREEIAIVPKLERETQELLRWIDYAGLVASIHIRRGDYANDPAARKTHGLVGLEYYERAIEIIEGIAPSASYLIFSDEPEWVRENFPLKDKVRIVRRNILVHESEDLFVMSRCQHHIIANSSFSWWGAWLGYNPDKCVIAPQKWFNDFNADVDDLFPAGWIRI